MTKYKTVEEFLNDQEPEKLEIINAVREIILKAEPSVTENIEWNAPNYVYKDQDRTTFNVMNKESKVKLILHMGATKKEDKKGEPILKGYEDVIEWSSDIRGYIMFEDVESVKRVKLDSIVREWLTFN